MATLPALTHHEIVVLVEPLVRAGRRVDLDASDRDARRIALRRVERPGDPSLQETLALDCRQPQRLVLERTLTRPDGIAATLSATGPDAGELLRQIEAVPPARHFSAGPGWVIARSYEVWTRSRGDELFMERALIAVEGLRCELALRLPNLRSVAGDIRIEAAPGHRLELPEDLLAVLGWDWVRLERKRDAWVSKLRLRGAALARSARAERALERAAPHLARVLQESPAQFHQRHLAARWGVMLRRSIPTATALGMIGGALLLPRLFDAQARAGLWMALHYVPIALLALSFRLQEMSQFEIPRWPRKPRQARWCEPVELSKGMSAG
jgi:hypothetical protein